MKINMNIMKASLFVSAVAVAAVAGNAGAQTFSNPTPITIPSSGPGSVYPSAIAVAGVPLGPAYEIEVTLHELSHTWPDDIDILLTGPGGFSVILMSDAGGSADLVGVTLTFVDGAASLPDSTAITSGVYAPTNWDAGDTWPAPAPAGPYGSTLNSFVGDPNGTWNLWIVDDTGSDSGELADGWEITFTTVPAPGALALLGLAGLTGARRRRN